MRFIRYFTVSIILLASSSAFALHFFLCFGPDSQFEPAPICAKSGFNIFLVKDPEPGDEENIALFAEIRGKLKKASFYYKEVKSREYRANLGYLSDEKFADIVHAVSEIHEKSRIYKQYEHYRDLVGVYTMKIRPENSKYPVDANLSCGTMLRVNAKYAAGNAILNASDDGAQEAKETTQNLMDRLRGKK